MRKYKVIDIYFSLFLFQVTVIAPMSLIFMKDTDFPWDFLVIFYKIEAWTGEDKIL